MIEGVQKRFSVDESGVVHLNAAANSNALLSIEDCLPKNMVRNPEYLKNDKYISAALLPNNIATMSENSDFHKPFTDEHVQCVFRRDISAAYLTDSKRC